MLLMGDMALRCNQLKNLDFTKTHDLTCTNTASDINNTTVEEYNGNNDKTEQDTRNKYSRRSP